LLLLAWWISRSCFGLPQVQRIAALAADASRRTPILVFLAVTGAHAVTMALTLPTKALLSLLAGALLGTVWGATSTLCGVMLGTTALFFAARHLLRERVASGVGDLGRRLEASISRRPIRAMIGLRLFITLPFGPITLAAALSRMRYRDFAAGTLIGDLPVIVLYVAAGSELMSLTTAQRALHPTSIAVLSLAGLAVFASVFLKRPKDV